LIKVNRQKGNPVPLELKDPLLSKKLSPKTLDTELGTVEYVEVGEGPVVVALHGAMGGYDQSIILAQTIGSTGYRYIGMTRPGYLGTPIKSGRKPEAQGDLIAALLDALGVQGAGVVAVSGGGPAALFFGLRHSTRCRGLILVSTCADIVEMSIPFSFKITQFLARFPWFVKRIQRSAEKDLVNVARRSICDPEILERTVNDTETWPLFSTMLLSTSYRMGDRILGTENDIEITRTTTYPLEDLVVPVLIIHGTDDRLVQFDKHVKQYETRIPGAEILAVKGGEHVAIFTHRKIIREKVNAFMIDHLNERDV